MNLITRDIPELFRVNVNKTRSDDYCSRFHRLFVSRIFGLAAIASGLYWYNGSLSCDAKGLDVDPGYLQSVCWMSELYLFPQVSRLLGGKHVALSTHIYGIPDDLSVKKVYANMEGRPCTRRMFMGTCENLRKRRFTTYIWTPFLMIAFVLVISIPYYISRFTSAGVIRFKKNLATAGDPKVLHEEYFHDGYPGYKYVLHKMPPVLYLAVDIIIMVVLSNLLGTNFWK